MTIPTSTATGHALRSNSSFDRFVVRRNTALSSLTLLLAMPALAQEPAALAPLEEIQVTGSRIERTGFTTPVPVTSLSIDELRAFDPGLGLSGQLETLPQFFGNYSSDHINNQVSANVGQSNVNMRGMGLARTLVLLDGSRIVPSDRQSSVSVDYLPSALIRRVEVVTGGASAAYGADAVAGVTNFILDREFTGLEINAQGGINEFGDGEHLRGSIAWGAPMTDRLHVFGSFESKWNPSYQRGTRDDPFAAGWDKRWGYVLNPDWVAATPAERESGNVPQRLTVPYVHSTQHTSTGLITQPGFAYHRYQFTEDGASVTPFIVGDYFSTAGIPGNLNTQSGQGAQYNQFRRGFAETFNRIKVQQETAFLGMDYDLTDRVTLWGHGLYGQIASQFPRNSSILGHSPLAFLTYFVDNPFLPDAVRDAMIAEDRQTIRVDQHGFFSQDFGYQEQPTNKHSLWSLTAGVNAELPGGWSLRSQYQYGEAEKFNSGRNWQRLDRTYLALDAIEDPDNPGSIICRIQWVERELAAQGRNLEQELHEWAMANTSIFRQDAGRDPRGLPSPIPYPISVDSIDNTIRDCVPLNMMGHGNQSRAALDYIFSDRHKNGISVQRQHFAEALVTGTLHEGWGAGTIETAFGGTFRAEDISQRIYDLEIDALGPPMNVTLPDGTVAIRGISPIIAGGGANLHRFSGQPTFSGNFNVWELFNETIVPLYTSEGGGQRVELSLASRYADYSRAGSIWVYKGGLDFQITNDLRFRGTRSRDIREGSFAELFDFQGRGANISDPVIGGDSYTTFDITGGNLEIEPEKAETTVLGVVYQPSFLPGLSLSADWYDVDLTSAIGTFTPQQIVDQCFESNVLCDRIDRDPETQRVTLVRATYVNIDSARVRGWDLEASYRMQPNLFANRSEMLSLRALGGYLAERSTTPLGGTTTNQAGGSLSPNWTTTGTISYQVDRVGMSLQQNWDSAGKRNVNWVEGVHVDNNRIGSRSYTNLGLSYTVDRPRGSWRTSLNVNNLFNRDPVIGGTTRVGDELGRRYTLGLRYTQ